MTEGTKRQRTTDRIDGKRVSGYSRVPSDIEKLFYGQLVKALVDRRVLLGYTQEQLDARIGATEGQVAKWEGFFRLPGAFMLVCWANALDMTIGAMKPDDQ